ncbi:MAG TPA: 2-oxo acid dehydrogenase subunit E2 [candidate division Zixibacteria bacterium]|nr:2-oxo acid dehydrogenase subunit E2 [candidate division Zixibacteria bacterium]
MKKYTAKKFPKIRKLFVDILNRAVLHHTLSGFTEYDITKPREIMNKLKQEKNKKISFLAFFADCLAKALNENKIIQGMKIGNRKVVIFEEIDICTIIESEENWQKVPLMYIVRDAGNKNLTNINHEIQDVKSNLNTYYNNFESTISKYLFLPQFLRKIILKWKYHRDPIFRKKLGGTVCLTSISIMFGE